MTENTGTPSAQSYTISVNLYGQRPQDRPNEDVPCHVGLALYQTREQCLPATCALHQIRAPNGYIYAYEHRPSQPLANDPILNVCCELCRDVSPAEVARATNAVTAFGNDAANLPEWAVGNCQDWLAGAVECLERQDLVPQGDGHFWRHAVGKGRSQMEDDWKKAGRQTKDGPAKSFVKGSIDADAKWSDREVREVGKLNVSEDVQTMLGSLRSSTYVGPSK